MADENNNNQLASTTGHEDEKIDVQGLKAALQKFKTDLLDAGLAGKVATSTYNALVTRVENIEQLMGDATTPDQDNVINKVREMIAFFVNVAETDTLTGLLTNLETRVREQYAYVTTLNAAPTSSTLTYTIGSGASAVTYNYKVGDEVRVLDSQRGTTDSHSYIYYKLYDLVTTDNVTTAYWDLVGGGMSAGTGIVISNNEISINDDEVPLMEDEGEGSQSIMPEFDAYLDSVHTKAQTLTEAKKAQARTNIGAQKIITNGAEIGFGLATCATAGNVQAKEVTITNFVLKENAFVSVLFANGFTASNPTLNINSTGAKAIKLYGNAIPMGKVKKNTILTMVYDGTDFNVVSIESQIIPSGDAVDLGLPSGLLWADHNVGAVTPEATGLFFSWGNVDGHTSNSGYDFVSNYFSSPGSGISNSIAVGDTYDAARHNMGNPWRMPTKDEFVELYDNCDTIQIEENGVLGIRFVSRQNNNAIFFPFAGCFNDQSTYTDYNRTGTYWSSDLYASSYPYRIALDLGNSVKPDNHDVFRHRGCSIRAVQ